MSTSFWKAVNECGIGLRKCILKLSSLDFEVRVLPNGEVYVKSNPVSINVNDLKYFHDIDVNVRANIQHGITIKGKVNGYLVQSKYFIQFPKREVKSFKEFCNSINGVYVTEHGYEFCIITTGNYDIQHDLLKDKIVINNIELSDVTSFKTLREVSQDMEYPMYKTSITCSTENKCVLVKRENVLYVP